jgi:hypothetical protein
MKTVVTTFLILVFSFCQAQLKLSNEDLNNLIAIGEIYSANPNAKGEKFSKSMDSLRTAKLSNITNTLIEVGKGEKSILDSKFLSRPSDDELVMWYVIREIHYNRVSKTKTPIDVKLVANDILSKKIDGRWLLDNYYYRIHGGIAAAFNENDLSGINIDIEKLGLRDQTEKSIFFLSMMDALVGGRFKVLKMLKKNDKIAEFSHKLPKFNGKEYYYYKNFEFTDFDYRGYETSESYKKRNIGNLYSILMAHFVAVSEAEGKKEGQEIYYNSIMFEPKYFEFTEAKSDLEIVYKKSK